MESRRVQAGVVSGGASGEGWEALGLMAAGQTIDTKIASGDSCPELKLPGLDLDGLHGRNFMVIDDEPLPTLHDGTGVGRKGYTCDRSNRPGTRGSSGRRPLTRGSSGSRPGTRENNLPGSRQSGRSDASSANQVAEADSFRKIRAPLLWLFMVVPDFLCVAHCKLQFRNACRLQVCACHPFE